MELRGDYANAREDYTVEQEPSAYTAEEHGVWRDLYRRQSRLVTRYAAPEFVEGLRRLRTSLRVHRFARLVRR